MSKEGERPKDFEPVPDWTTIVHYLSDGAKTLSATMIWTKGQEQVIYSNLSHLSQLEKTFYASAPKDFNLKTFRAELSKGNSEDCLFSVSLPTANLFFKTRFMGQEPAGLKFTIPATAFKVQRRKNVRYQIPVGHVMKIEFQDPLSPDVIHKKKVIDLSAGGLAFITEEKDLHVYCAGLHLSNFQFTIRLKKFCIEAEVRHARPLKGTPNEGKIKVGVVFLKMIPSDTELIASYVFDESRKYFARFL